MSEKKNNELTVAQNTDITGGYANTNGLALMNEIMAEDCQGLDFQLDRIKFAAGGTTILELPGDGDEPEMVKTLVADA